MRALTRFRPSMADAPFTAPCARSTTVSDPPENSACAGSRIILPECLQRTDVGLLVDLCFPRRTLILRRWIMRNSCCRQDCLLSKKSKISRCIFFSRCSSSRLGIAIARFVFAMVNDFMSACDFLVHDSQHPHSSGPHAKAPY